MFKRNEKLDFSWGEKKKRKTYHILLCEREIQGDGLRVWGKWKVRETGAGCSWIVYSTNGDDNNIGKRVETSFEKFERNSPLIIETY